MAAIIIMIVVDSVESSSQGIQSGRLAIAKELQHVCLSRRRTVVAVVVVVVKSRMDVLMVGKLTDGSC
jgi:hypothetical protein